MNLDSRGGKCDRGVYLSLLLGTLVFLAVTGGTILWPTNIDWLMVGDDGGASYLGWEFFRQAPLLQLPLGANPRYGMEISSSIVFTDAPLMPLLLKPFSPVLPAVFQYHGIWLLCCFLLQSFFAYKLMTLFADGAVLRLAGTLFFLIAPVFLFRISLSHYVFGGQWLLLAALYLYASTEFRRSAWIGLLVVAALINAYLLLMTGGFYVADCIRRLWCREIDFRRAALHSLASGALTLCVMWLAGYFMASKYTADQGYGFYRMNLLAIVNPVGSWSRVLPQLPGGAGDFEGFSYLGLGGLGLLCCVPFCLGHAARQRIRLHFVLPLLLMVVCTAVFAVSNKVAFGSHELLSWDIPPRLWPLVSTFRSSGRFFWPTYYLVLCACLYLVISRLRWSTATAVVLFMLGIQMADISGGVLDIRSRLNNPPPWVSPMQSALWDRIAGRYGSITVVLPSKHYGDYLPLAHFAVTHGMSTNGVYLGRVHQRKLRESCDRIASEVRAGAFQRDSLYVFGDPEQWDIARKTARPCDLVQNVDGFRLLAPGLAVPMRGTAAGP